MHRTQHLDVESGLVLVAAEPDYGPDRFTRLHPLNHIMSDGRHIFIEQNAIINKFKNPNDPFDFLDIVDIKIRGQSVFKTRP